MIVTINAKANGCYILPFASELSDIKLFGKMIDAISGSRGHTSLYVNRVRI